MHGITISAAASVFLLAASSAYAMTVAWPDPNSPISVKDLSAFGGADTSDRVITVAGYGFGDAGTAGYGAMEYLFEILAVGDGSYAGTDDLVSDFEEGASSGDTGDEVTADARVTNGQPRVTWAAFPAPEPRFMILVGLALVAVALVGKHRLP